MIQPGETGLPAPSAHWFATTHWSVVLAAGQGESLQARAALERLCQTYWPPLYAYIRRRGYEMHDAQDLTQEFFARLLARESLGAVAPGKGRFRSFLLAAVNHFLCDERDRATRQKRGGGCWIVSFEAQSAEARYRLEPVDALTPEKLFERRWALALLDQTLGRLEREFAGQGKAALFTVLKEFLLGGAPHPDYASAGARLGLNEGAVRVAVHRLRRRYGELFREEIAQTVANAEELEEEMRHLLAVLSG